MSYAVIQPLEKGGRELAVFGFAGTDGQTLLCPDSGMITATLTSDRDGYTSGVVIIEGGVVQNDTTVSGFTRRFHVSSS